MQALKRGDDDDDVDDGDDNNDDDDDDDFDDSQDNYERMTNIIIVEVNDDFTGQIWFLFKIFLPKLILSCLQMIAMMVYNYSPKGM